MRIIKGADGKTLDSKISKIFGHAPHYLLYD